MGGHSKKSGRGGGGTSRKRNRNELGNDRKKLTKDPGVPDLQHVSDKLMRSKAARKQLGIPAFGKGKSLVSGGNWAKRALFPKRSADVHNTHDGNEMLDGEEEENEQEILAARKSEMTVLALQASKRVHQYEEPLADMQGDEDDEGGFIASNGDRGTEKSLRRFYREFRRVVEACDVLLQVVDVRDPLGCRLSHLERSIRSEYGDKKTIVIVLNKIDLVPSKEVTDAWIHYFQEEEGLICVPFVANSKGNSGVSYVSNLFKTLRMIARGGNEDGARKSILVGVIGYPNVGKSSIINALKRKTVVGVGNMPGVTTGNTEVDLRNDVRVMDCPGVVMPGEDSGDVVLRNAVKISELENPFAPVERLLQRCAMEDSLASAIAGEHTGEERRIRSVHPLAQVYQIGSFDPMDTMEFIRLVGIRRGRLRHGGEVDEEQTARMILSDWNDGRIAYFTLPPSVQKWNTSSNRQDDGKGGEGGSGPIVLTKLSSGLTMDHLPTFHLSLRHCTMIGEKKMRKQSGSTNDDYYSSNADWEEGDEEEYDSDNSDEEEEDEGYSGFNDTDSDIESDSRSYNSPQMKRRRK